ncbi:MAG: FAD binding domain-containing protein [Devosia sp.]
MIDRGTEWFAPTTRAEAIALRAERRDEATIVAGGTFLGVLMNNGMIAPSAMIALRDVEEFKYVRVDGDLHIGAMTTHREIELHPLINRLWPSLSHMFSLVANPRIRNWATIGGVLADADYASDPPAMLIALNARAVVESRRGKREIPIEELILGAYHTAIADDELLVEVVVPAGTEKAVYRKFRTRSHEDRPCVSVAAARHDGKLRLAVGAVSPTPQMFPDICAIADGRSITSEMAADIGRSYADSIAPLDDARGSGAYRKRVIAVEVRRALEALAS